MSFFHISFTVTSNGNQSGKIKTSKSGENIKSQIPDQIDTHLKQWLTKGQPPKSKMNSHPTSEHKIKAKLATKKKCKKQDTNKEKKLKDIRNNKSMKPSRGSAVSGNESLERMQKQNATSIDKIDNSEENIDQNISEVKSGRDTDEMTQSQAILPKEPPIIRFPKWHYPPQEPRRKQQEKNVPAKNVFKKSGKIVALTKNTTTIRPGPGWVYGNGADGRILDIAGEGPICGKIYTMEPRFHHSLNMLSHSAKKDNIQARLDISATIAREEKVYGCSFNKGKFLSVEWDSPCHRLLNPKNQESNKCYSNEEKQLSSPTPEETLQLIYQRSKLPSTNIYSTKLGIFYGHKNIKEISKKAWSSPEGHEVLKAMKSDLKILEKRRAADDKEKAAIEHMKKYRESRDKKKGIQDGSFSPVMENKNVILKADKPKPDDTDFDENTIKDCQNFVTEVSNQIPGTVSVSTILSEPGQISINNETDAIVSQELYVADNDKASDIDLLANIKEINKEMAHNMAVCNLTYKYHESQNLESKRDFEAGKETIETMKITESTANERICKSMPTTHAWYEQANNSDRSTDSDDSLTTSINSSDDGVCMPKAYACLKQNDIIESCTDSNDCITTSINLSDNEMHLSDLEESIPLQVHDLDNLSFSEDSNTISTEDHTADDISEDYLDVISRQLNDICQSQTSQDSDIFAPLQGSNIETHLKDLPFLPVMTSTPKQGQTEKQQISLTPILSNSSKMKNKQMKKLSFNKMVKVASIDSIGNVFTIPIKQQGPAYTSTENVVLELDDLLSEIEDELLVQKRLSFSDTDTVDQDKTIDNSTNEFTEMSQKSNIFPSKSDKKKSSDRDECPKEYNSTIATHISKTETEHDIDSKSGDGRRNLSSPPIRNPPPKKTGSNTKQRKSIKGTHSSHIIENEPFEADVDQLSSHGFRLIDNIAAKGKTIASHTPDDIGTTLSIDDSVNEEIVESVFSTNLKHDLSVANSDSKPRGDGGIVDVIGNAIDVPSAMSRKSDRNTATNIKSAHLADCHKNLDICMTKQAKSETNVEDNGRAQANTKKIKTNENVWEKQPDTEPYISLISARPEKQKGNQDGTLKCKLKAVVVASTVNRCDNIETSDNTFPSKLNGNQDGSNERKNTNKVAKEMDLEDDHQTSTHAEVIKKRKKNGKKKKRTTKDTETHVPLINHVGARTERNQDGSLKCNTKTVTIESLIARCDNTNISDNTFSSKLSSKQDASNDKIDITNEIAHGLFPQVGEMDLMARRRKTDLKETKADSFSYTLNKNNILHVRETITEIDSKLSDMMTAESTPEILTCIQKPFSSEVSEDCLPSRNLIVMQEGKAVLEVKGAAPFQTEEAVLPKVQKGETKRNQNKPRGKFMKNMGKNIRSFAQRISKKNANLAKESEKGSNSKIPFQCDPENSKENKISSHMAIPCRTQAWDTSSECPASLKSPIAADEHVSSEILPCTQHPEDSIVHDGISVTPHNKVSHPDNKKKPIMKRIKAHLSSKLKAGYETEIQTKQVHDQGAEQHQLNDDLFHLSHAVNDTTESNNGYGEIESEKNNCDFTTDIIELRISESQRGNVLTSTEEEIKSDTTMEVIQSITSTPECTKSESRNATKKRSRYKRAAHKVSKRTKEVKGKVRKAKKKAKAYKQITSIFGAELLGALFQRATGDMTQSLRTKKRTIIGYLHNILHNHKQDKNDNVAAEEQKHSRFYKFFSIIQNKFHGNSINDDNDDTSVLDELETLKEELRSVSVIPQDEKQSVKQGSSIDWNNVSVDYLIDAMANRWSSAKMKQIESDDNEDASDDGSDWDLYGNADDTDFKSINEIKSSSNEDREKKYSDDSQTVIYPFGTSATQMSTLEVINVNSPEEVKTSKKHFTKRLRNLFQKKSEYNFLKHY